MRWGILGTGKIARIFADGIARSRTGELHAVASRDGGRADAFAREFDAARAHRSYDDLIADPGVEVVYVATPHPTHLDLGRQAAANGKHLLCEKPLAVTAADAEALVDAARSADVFLMEAFAFRAHPQTAYLRDVLESGALGDVRYVEASFGYDAGPSPANYLLRHDLAGGSILDVGCYTVSMVQLVAGALDRAAFAAPRELAAVGLVGDLDRCDHYAAASLAFDNGLVAQIACGVQVGQPNTLVVHGTRGRLVADSPWLPGRLGEATSVTVVDAGGEAHRETFELDAGANLYSVEADHVAEAIAAGKRESPAISWADTVAIMRTIDRWHDAVGLDYS